MNGNKMNGMNGCGCGNQMNRPNNGCGCSNQMNRPNNGCGNQMNRPNNGCGTLLCYGRQEKGWKTSIYSMEDDNVLSHPSVHDSRSKKEVRADFEQFLQEVFRENVTSDGITFFIP